MHENVITDLIIGTCVKIHKQFGPGLFESVYEELFCYEWKKRAIPFCRQKEVPLVFETVRLDVAFRADVIIDDKVLLEIKSIETLAPVHSKQVLTYLKLTGIKVGLIVNFNENLIKDGI